jgi:hypothetical protein
MTTLVSQIYSRFKPESNAPRHILGIAMRPDEHGDSAFAILDKECPGIHYVNGETLEARQHRENI